MILKLICTYFLSQKNFFYFIALSETYLNDTNCFDFDDLPGYHPFSLCEKHRTGRKGGGVGLFIDDQFKFTVREDLSYFSPEIELVVAEIKSNDNFLICSLYRPPGCDLSELIQFRNFINSFLSMVKQAKVKACYILGDININLLNYGKQSSSGYVVSELIDTFFADNYVPLILSPTRIDPYLKSLSLIDNIFTILQAHLIQFLEL